MTELTDMGYGGFKLFTPSARAALWMHLVQPVHWVRWIVDGVGVINHLSVHYEAELLRISCNGHLCHS